MTGLHIGGTAGALEIGGVDSPVIRNPLNNQPYIPGSSFRGKMRSLTERLHGSDQNFQVGRARAKKSTCTPARPTRITSRRTKHATSNGRRAISTTPEVSGLLGLRRDRRRTVPHPTSLVVRDVFLSSNSVTELNNAQTDFPYTEIKWEATIDRVTSAATPRQIERVPAGAVFEGFEPLTASTTRPACATSR